jgi:hypothetical protein
METGTRGRKRAGDQFVYEDGNTDAISLSMAEGTRAAIGLSKNLTAEWNPRNQFVASVADSPAFRGRPSGRTVCSRPGSANRAEDFRH